MTVTCKLQSSAANHLANFVEVAIEKLIGHPRFPADVFYCAKQASVASIKAGLLAFGESPSLTPVDKN